MEPIFITGGTGYMGRQLIPILLERQYPVRALTRPGSGGKLPKGCTPVLGDALDAASYAHLLEPSETLVQLVGTPKPNPRKGKEFRAVDFKSGMAAVAAAHQAKVRHLVYVSVAHPAPMMHAYIEPRVEVEEAICDNGLNATILRPWYVLGPDHRWPYLILPGYWIMGLFPSKRAAAQRLGLITLKQMLVALVHAIENPAQGIRVLKVPEIRKMSISNLSGTKSR